MVVTYAHTDQNILLPRLVSGTQRRHLALAISDGDFNVPTIEDVELDYGLYAPVDTCDACPPYGAPAISCDRHGYIFRGEKSEGVVWPSYEESPAFQPNSDSYCCEFCASTYDYPMYGDFYDYYDDNFDYLDDSLEESATVEQEIDAFADMYLSNEAPTKPQPWQQENDRHYTAKYKRAFRAAISRSDSHRRRDSSVAARGRHGAVSRSYESGVTPRYKYLAKKEADF
jgi:hypothetical protein